MGGQQGSLTLGGSTLYGVTPGGGTYTCGQIFKINTDGSGLQILYSVYGGLDGAHPQGSLTVSGSTLYGMTYMDGANGDGTVFSIRTNGTSFKNLLSFSGISGAYPGMNPCGDLTLIGSRLYGMTDFGGANGDGNIFSINTDGSGFQNLFSFNDANGLWPLGGLTQIGSTLYGMTENGGANHEGTIFKINTDGSGFQSLLSFSGTGGTFPGMNPYGDLMVSGSTLYGMTQEGGPNNDGVIFSLTVPEPSTFVLLGVGAIGLMGWAWRRRQIS